MNKGLISLLLVVFVIMSPVVLNEVSSQSQVSPLPEPSSIATTTLAVDLSPIQPIVVYNTTVFAFTMKPEYINVTLSHGYIYTVLFKEHSLKLYNYTISLVYHGNGIWNATIPDIVEEGLYDLVLISTNYQKYWIPRSVWVLRNPLTLLKILHISDLHYGAGHPNELIGHGKRFVSYTFGQLMGANIVFATGDNTDTAAHSQLKDFVAWRYMAMYNIPVFSTPGNHDYPVVNYNMYAGSNYYCKLVGDNLLIISVDTRDIGYVAWDQLVWLEETLMKHRDVPVKIVIVHYPLFYRQGELRIAWQDLTPWPTDPTSPVSSYWSQNITAAKEFLRILDQYAVDFVLAGHVHRDMFVNYTSPITGNRIYFLTITSTGQSAAFYSGFNYYNVNLVDFNITFPYAPPWAVGFRNESTSRSYQSIPNAPPELQSSWPPQLPPYYLAGNITKSSYSYVISLVNNMPNLTVNGTVIYAFPWSGSLVNFVILESEGIRVKPVNYLLLDNILYIAIDYGVESTGRVRFLLSNAIDREPPVVKYLTIVPKIPRINGTAVVYLEISDDAWGVTEVKSYIINDSSLVPIKLTRVEQERYTLEYTARGTSTTWISVLIQVSDNTGKESKWLLEIPFYDPREMPPAADVRLKPIIEPLVKETTTTVTTTQVKTETLPQTTTTVTYTTTYTEEIILTTTATTRITTAIPTTITSTETYTTTYTSIQIMQDTTTRNVLIVIVAMLATMLVISMFMKKK